MPSSINLIAIAENAIDQAQGLKFIRHLEQDTGMLFKFQSPKVLSFWMQDTIVPLDIAFIDQDNTIVKTERMIPLSLRSVTSGRPCVMALEVPAGTFDIASSHVGRKIQLDLVNNRMTIHD